MTLLGDIPLLSQENDECVEYFFVDISLINNSVGGSSHHKKKYYSTLINPVKSKSFYYNSLITKLREHIIEKGVDESLQIEIEELCYNASHLTLKKTRKES